MAVVQKEALKASAGTEDDIQVSAPKQGETLSGKGHASEGRLESIYS